MNTSDRNISGSKAADLLKVSQATLMNWVRSGMIENNNGFSEKKISEVIKLIGSKKINKLNSRANKRTSPRSVTGSFYTPLNAVEEIISKYKIPAGSKICDPCCGNGRFLIPIAQRHGKNVELFGYDTDNAAVVMVQDQLSLLPSCSTVRMTDSLQIRESEKYDYIFTNPPWGAHYTAKEKNGLKKLYPQSGSSDSLEFFILKGLESLKSGGIMSYLLPESFFHVRRFSKIREFLLRNTKILFLKNYGRIFSGVFTQAVRLDIKKEEPSLSHYIEIGKPGKTLIQNDLLKEPYCSFNITATRSEREFIDSIYSKPHFTLKGRAEWNLGIVTGNNKEFVSSEKSKEHNIPIISGKNVKAFKIEGKLHYLKNDFTRMQQVPGNMIFSKEKLFYKFISDKLVFAYDSSGVISLNSANVMIPCLPGYPLEAVAAILNSDLINFVYKKKFNSLKVLRSNLEKLPFPKYPDRSIIDLLKDKVITILTSPREETMLRNEINSLIYKLYGVEK